LSSAEMLFTLTLLVPFKHLIIIQFILLKSEGD
jgi:hypothetical protein